MVASFNEGQLTRSLVRVPNSGWDRTAGSFVEDLSRVSSAAGMAPIPRNLPFGLQQQRHQPSVSITPDGKSGQTLRDSGASEELPAGSAASGPSIGLLTGPFASRPPASGPTGWSLSGPSPGISAGPSASGPSPCLPTEHQLLGDVLPRKLHEW